MELELWPELLAWARAWSLDYGQSFRLELGLGLRRGVFRGLEDLLVLKNRAFYMLLIACLTSSIRPSPRALWPLEVGSCAPLATFPLLLTTNLEFKI